MIELKDIYIRNENTVTREIAGETLIVPISGKLADLERVFTLNSVGALIWQLIDGKVNLESVLVKVVEEFDVNRTAAELDLLELVGNLIDAGLVSKTD